MIKPNKPSPNRRRNLIALLLTSYSLLATAPAQDPDLPTGAGTIDESVVTQTVHVNGTSGNDSTGTGTSGNPYKTIGKGITSAGTKIANNVGVKVLIAPGIYRENSADLPNDTGLKFSNYKTNAPLVIEGAGWNSTEPQNTGDVIISGSEDWSRKNSAAAWSLNTGNNTWTPPAPNPGIADSGWTQNADGTWSKPWPYAWGLENRAISTGVFVDAVRRRNTVHVNGVSYYPVNPPSATWPFYQNTDAFDRAYLSAGSGTAEIRVIAKATGSAGMGIALEMKNPGVASAPLSVSLSAKAITVNLATNSSGTITSTANAVRDALLANSTIASFANVTSAGTGVVAAFAKKFVALPAGYEGDLATGGRVTDDEGSFWVTDAVLDGLGNIVQYGTITLIPPANQAALAINSAQVEVSTKSRMVFLQAYFNKSSFDNGTPQNSQETNVIFRNITVEQGTSNSFSAFFQYQNKLLIEDCRFINNRFVGLQLNTNINVTVRRTEISGNGNNGAQFNLLTNALVENVSFNRNSRLSEILGFTGWSVCGIKLMRCTDTTLYRCEAIDNRSTGFWWDGGNLRCELLESVATGNSSNGTFIEVNSSVGNNHVINQVSDLVRGIPGLGDQPTVTVTRSIIAHNRPNPDAASYRTNKGRGVFIAENENGQVDSSLIYDNDIQIGTYDNNRGENRNNGVTNSALIATTADQRLYAVASDWDSAESIAAANNPALLIKGGWYAFYDGLNGTNTNDNVYTYAAEPSFPARSARSHAKAYLDTVTGIYQPPLPTLSLAQWQADHLANTLDTQTANEAVDSRSRLVSTSYGEQPLVVLNPDAATIQEGAASTRLFTVHRVSPGGYDAPLTVNYSVVTGSGLAYNGADIATLSGTLTIPAGERSAGISVTPRTDAAFEGTETLRLRLASHLVGGVESFVYTDRNADVAITDATVTPLQPLVSITPSAIATASGVTISTIVYGTTQNSWVRYNSIDFGSGPGVDRLVATVSKGITNASSIAIYINPPAYGIGGTLVGTLNVSPTINPVTLLPSYGTYNEQTANLTSALTGVQDILLVFSRQGAANLGAIRFLAPAASAVALSPAPGSYSNSVTVSGTSTTPGAVLRYTTNGTDPTSSSPSLPVVLTSTTTLKVRATAAGYNDGPVTTGTYTVTIPPVIALGNNNSTTTTTDYITDGSGAYINAGRYTATTSANLTTIRARVGGITGSYQLAIYSDSATLPASLLGTTQVRTGVSTGWQAFTLNTSVAVTSGTSYWLAIWSNDTNARVYCTTTGGKLRWKNQPYVNGGWPASLATTDGSVYHYCLYAEGTATMQSMAMAPPPVQSFLSASDDSDGDGTVDLLETALGSDPLSAVAAGSSTRIDRDPATGRLSITFLRARADLRYVVEASGNLATWQIIATDPGEVSATVPVTVVDSDPLPGESASRYLRLRVSRPDGLPGGQIPIEK